VINIDASEGWAPIERFPNHAISIHGDVIGLRRGHVLKPFDDRYGYLRLSLGNTDNVYIHRLVAETFLIKPYGLFEVNHVDGDKHNNYYLNLEWVTKSENIRHAISMGLQDPSIGLRQANRINRERYLARIGR